MSNFTAQSCERQRNMEDGTFPSKRALKEHVDAGRPVWFRDTSMINPRGTIGIAEMRPADVIVGPHEYKRKWYANVKNGKVV
jgi:hypothetical protein